MTGGGLHIEIRGTVQGVGYRPWVFQLARRMDIRGIVRNDCRGVSIDAFGTSDALDRFVTALRSDTPPAARLRYVTYLTIPFVSHSPFAIADS
jgi:hydrogenase maturation protein HypF